MNNIIKHILGEMMEKFPTDTLGECLVGIYAVATDIDLTSLKDETTTKAMVAKMMGTTPEKLEDLAIETPLDQLRIFRKMMDTTIKALEKAA